MTRTIAFAVLAFVVGAIAHADVTLKQTATGKGLGMSGTTTSTTYIKGLKMRVESVTGKKSNTTIFDVDNQKMYVLDTDGKQADVWNMASFSQEVSQSVSVDGMRASIKPNGQKKPVAGHETDGYDMEIVVPTTVGGAGGMNTTVLLTGPTWIAKKRSRSADYAALYAGAAQNKGWIFSDPRAAKGSPGPAKAMAEMYAEFAKTGGVALETQMDIKPQAEGMLGSLMSKMGNLSMTTTTDSFETSALGEDLFQVPGGLQAERKAARPAPVMRTAFEGHRVAESPRECARGSLSVGGRPAVAAGNAAAAATEKRSHGTNSPRLVTPPRGAARILASVAASVAEVRRRLTSNAGRAISRPCGSRASRDIVHDRQSRHGGRAGPPRARRRGIVSIAAGLFSTTPAQAGTRMGRIQRLRERHGAEALVGVLGHFDAAAGASSSAGPSPLHTRSDVSYGSSSRSTVLDSSTTDRHDKRPGRPRARRMDQQSKGARPRSDRYFCGAVRTELQEIKSELAGEMIFRAAMMKAVDKIYAMSACWTAPPEPAVLDPALRQPGSGGPRAPSSESAQSRAA